MNIRAVASLILTSMVLFSAVLAQDKPASTASTQTAADGAEIYRLIARLGDDTFAERKKAQQALVKIGLAALPALIKATGSPDPEFVSSVKAIKNEILKEAFQAKVGNVTVRLTGVTSRPTRSDGWWLPDGEPLAAPPLGAPDVPTGANHDRVFGIQVVGPEDARMHVQFLPGPSSTKLEGGEGDLTGGERTWDFFYVASFRGSLQSVTVDVGIEESQWETVAIAQPGETAKDARGRPVKVGDFKQNGDKTGVTCNYVADVGWKYRNRLIKTDGGKVEHSMMTGRTTNEKCESSLEFDVKLQDAASLLLERRQIRWVRFENVSLIPGRLADVAPARQIRAEQAGMWLPKTPTRTTTAR